MIAFHGSRLASRSILTRRVGSFRAEIALRSRCAPTSGSHIFPPPRCFSSKAPSPLPSGALEDRFKNYANSIQFQPATHELRDISEGLLDKPITVHGYVGNRLDLSKDLSFVTLFGRNFEHTIQLVSARKTAGDDTFKLVRSLNPQSPVVATGVLKSKKAGARTLAENRLLANFEIHLESIHCLNEFPSDILVAKGTNVPPEQRNIQIRLDPNLRNALAFRSAAMQICRQTLTGQGHFLEIETPILFKSTPEGAREFIVPTRTPGLAYALPQSPQQYKQLLMASGIPRYFQIARCFRDEDQRADRQPEFTQLDLEMAFATAEDVMSTIEGLLSRLWRDLLNVEIPSTFPRMTYEQAMSRYGSDKPDTRLGMEIKQVGYLLPVDMIKKITPLNDCIVDMMRFKVSRDPQTSALFIKKFMESPEAKLFLTNPDGQPGFCVCDSKKPLQGLQVLGFEAAEVFDEELSLEDGDILIFQARPNAPHRGGSTTTGRLRQALYTSAVDQGILQPPKGFSFLWVHEFPLFSPDEGDGTGQGGSRGFASTHHPFTAPKDPEDITLLETDPLSVRADHYDVVVNGVELGGGSRRIHDADFQQYVLKDVLGVSGDRLESFSHLLAALRAGCPPHAGIALGFDRLMVVMLGRESVRDVIAFPKTGSGEDPVVRSPTRISAEQLQTYHLKIAN